MHKFASVEFSLGKQSLFKDACAQLPKKVLDKVELFTKLCHVT